MDGKWIDIEREENRGRDLNEGRERRKGYRYAERIDGEGEEVLLAVTMWPFFDASCRAIYKIIYQYMYEYIV